MLVKHAYELIGNTPLIELTNIEKIFNLKAKLYAKVEYFNPAGSVKDRIALAMIEDAEKKGLLKGNYTIIEPTSGNTGIGLASIGAMKGYKVILTMPESMSIERRKLLQAYGAKIVLTDAKLGMQGSIDKAKELQKEIKNSIILGQFDNPSNPDMHYKTTGPEIYNDLNGKVDVFVAGIGTGGTITGVSRKLKEKLPNVKIIAIDPSGSILAKPDELNVGGYRNYKIEGVGQPFIPGNVTYDCVDEWVKVEDKEAFVMARRLLKEEGLMVGGSSGLAFAGAVDYIKKNKLDKDKRVIVFSCDGIRNYLSTFLSDDWMIENNFMTKEEYDEANYKDREDIKKRLPGKIGDIKDKLNEAKIIKNIENIKVRDLIKMFNELKIKVILALNEKNKLLGYFSKKNVTCCLASCKADLDGNAINVLTKDVRVLSLDDPLYFLSRAMPRFDFLPVKIDEEKYLIFEYENIYDFLSN